MTFAVSIPDAGSPRAVVVPGADLCTLGCPAPIAAETRVASC